MGNRPEAKTFREWCDIKILKYIGSTHVSDSQFSRIDFVFDQHLENSNRSSQRSMHINISFEHIMKFQGLS